MSAFAFLLLGFLVAPVTGFFVVRLPSRSGIKLRAEAVGGNWQSEIDVALDVDTDCYTRREKLLGLVKDRESRQQILQDVQTALKEDDENKKIELLSTGETRKALKGLVAFRKQLARDIIPDLLTKQLPALLTQGPSLPSTQPVSFPNVLERVRELTQDPILLQSVTDDVRREIKNVFKRTPEGLETPKYSIIKQTSTYEIRSYEGYSVCSTISSLNPNTPAGESSAFGDAFSAGKSFNTLAAYLFGENMAEEKMSMTTPVIMDGNNKMSFVLPGGKTATTAPLPKFSDEPSTVQISDFAPGIFAAKEFTGVATASEVAAQRALLEDALVFDGISFDNLSFQVLQYNPPYTLPWVRRNEVVLRVLDPRFATDSAEVITTPQPTFGDGTEAGD